MNKKDIEEKVREIIIDHLGTPNSQLKLNSELFATLGADSMNFICIIMEIEDAFEIEIPDEVIPNIQTLGKIIEFVCTKTGISK